MKDFSNWIKYERVAEASGTSEKIWLQNLDTGETGLFKFRKDKTTTDHVSESIAYRLACLLNLNVQNLKLESMMVNGDR